MAKKKDKTEENILAIEEALSKTELFIEKNQKIITIIVGIIVVVVIAFFGFRKLYMAPKEKEAQTQMFMAEKYFDKDSMNLALYGDGNYLGFLDIIEEYSITKSANLAKYYAGVCYLHLEDYENAIDYLNRFKGRDEMVSCMAIGAIGDAHMGLENSEEAAGYYLEAANHKTNNFTTPLYLFKAGKTYEHLNQYDKALHAYERIKDEFVKSYEARFIEKYIARVKGYLGEG
ncbi:MAG: tetratricopeptide repeat protein [Bacteroidales bacterium]|nr:tetratricopeptide repeat protein [Bacteroidales bacterium]